jgi:hypothetical protein
MPRIFGCKVVCVMRLKLTVVSVISFVTVVSVISILHLVRIQNSFHCSIRSAVEKNVPVGTVHCAVLQNQAKHPET